MSPGKNKIQLYGVVILFQYTYPSTVLKYENIYIFMSRYHQNFSQEQGNAYKSSSVDLKKCSCFLPNRSRFQSFISFFVFQPRTRPGQQRRVRQRVSECSPSSRNNFFQKRFSARILCCTHCQTGFVTPQNEWSWVNPTKMCFSLFSDFLLLSLSVCCTWKNVFIMKWSNLITKNR